MKGKKENMPWGRPERGNRGVVMDERASCLVRMQVLVVV